MKRKLVFITLISFFALLSFKQINANASDILKGPGYDYSAYSSRKVVTTREITLYHVKVGSSEYKNKFYDQGELPVGTRLDISSWIMSTGGGYVVTSDKYMPSKNWFYFVIDKSKNRNKWFTDYNSSYKKKLAKQKAVAKKKREAKQEKIYNQNVSYASSHPLIASQYKRVSAYVGDDVFDLHRNNLQDYEDSTNTISSYYAPNDSKAEVPHDYKPKQGDKWKLVNYDTNTIKVYKYIDTEQAKEFWNSDTPGWIYTNDETF